MGQQLLGVSKKYRRELVRRGLYRLKITLFVHVFRVYNMQWTKRVAFPPQPRRLVEWYTFVRFNVVRGYAAVWGSRQHIANDWKPGSPRWLRRGQVHLLWFPSCQR